jgi:hypothetical protein
LQLSMLHHRRTCTVTAGLYNVYAGADVSFVRWMSGRRETTQQRTGSYLFGHPNWWFQPDKHQQADA